MTVYRAQRAVSASKRHHCERTFRKSKVVRIRSVHCDLVTLLVQQRKYRRRATWEGYVQGTAYAVCEAYRETGQYLLKIFHS